MSRKAAIRRIGLALSAARAIVRGVCQCGHYNSEHYGGDMGGGCGVTGCACQRFKAAPLRVVRTDQ